MMNTFRISTKHPDELYSRFLEQEKDRSVRGSRTLQFEDEFLARVRVQTSADLLTVTGLVIGLSQKRHLWSKAWCWSEENVLKNYD